MYRKKETEFQYAPGIEFILEDIVGGGTVSREGLKGVIDELPPLCVVGKDSNGLWHVVKTAKIAATVNDGAVNYPVAKGTIFKVGDAVTLGGGLAGASDVISTIDKSGEDYDMLTLAGTIGAASQGDVLVLVSAKANAGSAALLYTPEAVTMNKVDTTVANQQSGLLARGGINESVMPFPIDANLKKLLSHIRFL